MPTIESLAPEYDLSVPAACDKLGLDPTADAALLDQPLDGEHEKFVRERLDA